MPKIIRTPAELEALPNGTEVVDNDGDTLRRVEGGMTYRAAGAHVTKQDIHPCSTLTPYMPMVASTAGVSPLDSPTLPGLIRDYLEQEFMPRYSGVDRTAYMTRAADDIIRIAKEHDK